jgi:hypothetical protein
MAAFTQTPQASATRYDKFRPFCKTQSSTPNNGMEHSSSPANGSAAVVVTTACAWLSVKRLHQTKRITAPWNRDMMIKLFFVVMCVDFSLYRSETQIASRRREVHDAFNASFLSCVLEKNHFRRKNLATTGIEPLLPGLQKQEWTRRKSRFSFG